MADIYDCIIIGGGPAGLGGAIYAARDGMKVLILEKFFPGGQINNTDRIENYPGIEQIDGASLVIKMQTQAVNFGTEILTGVEVDSLKKLEDGNIEITTSEEKKYFARAVILSPGSCYRKLGIPGEKEFRSAGTGVSYCGTCDAPFFTDKEVVAVGGGNTAIEETLHLAKFARKVTLIHRRGEFRADKILQQELMQEVSRPDNKIHIKYNTIPLQIQGKDKVESIQLKNVKTDQTESYPCDGVFIFVGMEPNTGFLNGFVELTDKGFVKCDERFRTNVPGVFVAGDCRVGAAMQLITAVNDGVVSALMLKQYFREPDWWQKSIQEEIQLGGW